VPDSQPGGHSAPLPVEKVTLEEHAMSDGISGIKTTKPIYPVKPVQPARRDRKSGDRKKDSPGTAPQDEGDDKDKPGIDEYI
jgi:hypothetical protein